MKAAVYLRVSTEEQRERQSIETQRQFAATYCQQHHIDVVEVFADDGVSGTIPFPDRPAGARLLAGVGDGAGIEAVLVYKIDRLGRDVRVVMNAIADLNKRGVRLVSMTEPFESNTSMGKFMSAILGAMAGLERDTILERSAAGTMRLAKEGAWLGGIVPYGYRAQGAHREARLVISDDPIPGLEMSEADVIRLVYHLCAEDGLSTQKIAEHLNALGVPTAYALAERHVMRGKRQTATANVWRNGRVHNLLVSTVYKGVHQYGKRSREREVVERPCPAIVDVEQWEKAQQTLARNALWSPRNTHHEYLLRGMIKCAMCGLTYIGRYHKRTARTYYNCSGKRAERGFYGMLGRKCPSKPLTGDIEEIVMRDILEFLTRPGTVMQHLAAQIQKESRERDKHVRRLGRLEQILARKGTERDRVVSLYRRGLITSEELDAQIVQVRSEV